MRISLLAVTLTTLTLCTVAHAQSHVKVEDGDKPASEKSESKSDGSSGGSTAKMPSFQSAGSASTPQGRTFGLGLQLGYPTAVTIKYMLKPDQGIVAGLGGFTGFSYWTPSLSLHADYVWHPHQLTATDVFALTWYFGGGANLFVLPYAYRARPFIPGFAYWYYPTSIWLAARMPFGANIAFQQVPFEFYFELVPMLMLFPALTFGMGADLGFRFYF